MEIDLPRLGASGKLDTSGIKPAGCEEAERIKVRVDVSERFARLLKTSSRAWEEGWRMDTEGGTYRIDTNDESAADPEK